MTKSRAVSIDLLLEGLMQRGATDLLVSVGSQPFVRVDGAIERLGDLPELTPEDTQRMTHSLLTPELLEEFAAAKEVDFSFNWRGIARLRANAFMQRGSVGLAVRVIPFRIPGLDELGIPDVIQPLLQLPQGLVLVTGPTGAGKSTTLASMIDWINENRALHILTIEDPIEYVHHHRRSAVHQREIGRDSPSFARALRSALREDPDVLLIGEMRDLESIQTALTIAETGHLVFATLHTNDTCQAVDRIIDVFPAERQAQIRVQLANALQAVVYQELLPRRDGGRIAAFEVMISTYAIRNMIKEGKTRQLRNAVATGQRDGMQSFEAGLESLVRNGIVAPEEARARIASPARTRTMQQESRGGTLFPA